MSIKKKKCVYYTPLEHVLITAMIPAAAMLLMKPTISVCVRLLCVCHGENGLYFYGSRLRPGRGLDTRPRGCSCVEKTRRRTTTTTAYGARATGGSKYYYYTPSPPRITRVNVEKKKGKQ